VITTGSFDGVHVGHTAIIKRLKDRARQFKAESVLITFFPHPRKVLFPDSTGKELLMINSQKEKINLLSEAGLDHLVILKFTLEFSRTSSSEFVKNILTNKLKAVHVIIGFNHHFGHNRKGDLTALLEMGQELGFTVEEIPEQDIQDETVSSTKIRKAIFEGEIQRANAYLDHPYFLESDSDFLLHPDNHYCYTLVKPMGEDKMLPPPGIYVAYISLENTSLREKAVFVIKEKESSTIFEAFPLDNAYQKAKGLISIQLYKLLDKRNNNHRLAEHIAEVGELIY
jgi:riboflavin kinase/FMN adenylyltransferase